MRHTRHPAFVKAAPRARRAFTLTEMAIVLGVVGLILAAIWSAASSVSDNNKIKRSQEQILQIVTNMRSLYATQQTFPPGTAHVDITPSMLVAFPSDMINASTGLPQNPWGTSVQIASLTSAPFGSLSNFQIYYGIIPINACKSLAARLVGLGSAGPTYFHDNTWKSATVPVSVAAIDCSGGNLYTAWKF